MNGFPSKARQALKPEALSGCSSSMGVEPNKTMASTAITIYIGNNTLQPSPKVGIVWVAPHMAI